MQRDSGHLLDMLLAARRIQEYTQGKSKEDFLTDSLLEYGTRYLIMVIGEAARRVSPSARAELPGIDWPEIIGTRNVVVHQYDNVELDTLWDIVQNDLPRLIETLGPLVPPDEPSSESS
ncbi:MAG: DUF86 domain-containing protein [Dehalococcoidia bacterium]